MRKIQLVLFIFILLVISTEMFGQQFVYTPINPSFGGNTFNHGWMMNEAEAQNKFTDPNSRLSSSFRDRDALSDFEESLKRQLLSQLSRQIISDTFGESEFKEGSYEIGNYLIEITNELDGVNIQIFDNSNGSETSIIIPYL